MMPLIALVGIKAKENVISVKHSGQSPQEVIDRFYFALSLEYLESKGC